MNNFYVLSIDQSTQGTKAVILNDSGIIQARHDLPHKQIINEMDGFPMIRKKSMKM